MKLTTSRLKEIISEELSALAEDTAASVKSVAQSAHAGCSKAVAAAIGNDEEIVRHFLSAVRQDSGLEPARILRDVINNYFTQEDLDDIALEIGAAAVEAAVENPEIDNLPQSGPSHASDTQAIKPLAPGSTEWIDIPGEEQGS